MHHLIESVRASMQAENWHGALASALMIPDVCANLERGKKSTRGDYINWCNTYVGHLYKHPVYDIEIGGEEIYVLRCSYLHQASSNVSKKQSKRILDHYRFVSPLKGWTFGTYLVDGRILQINIKTFCDLMCTAAEKWTRSVLERQDEVQLRSEELLKVRDARIDGLLLTGRSPPSTKDQPETGNTHTPENKHDDSLGIPRTQRQAPLDLTKK